MINFLEDQLVPRLSESLKGESLKTVTIGSTTAGNQSGGDNSALSVSNTPEIDVEMLKVQVNSLRSELSNFQDQNLLSRLKEWLHDPKPNSNIEQETNTKVDAATTLQIDNIEEVDYSDEETEIVNGVPVVRGIAVQ